jgi:allantoate deiminase
MALASLTRVGMLFIRCAGGVSHHPEESVLEADVALAIDAMHTAVLGLAGSYGDAERYGNERYGKLSI